MSEISIQTGSDLSGYSVEQLQNWIDANRHMNAGESADYLVWQSVGAYITLTEILQPKGKKIENPIVGQTFRVVKI